MPTTPETGATNPPRVPEHSSTPVPSDPRKKIENTNLNANQYYPPILSDTARFQPCDISGDGCGSISFQARSLASSPSTSFELDLMPDGSATDSRAFNVSEPLTLQGFLDIHFATHGHASSGTSWTIILTIAPSATAFTNALPAPKGFFMESLGDTFIGWSVVLTKKNDATILLLR